MYKNMKYTAIVLSAGKGSRMKSDIPKQYLMLQGKPVLYYALKAFEESAVDEIILVTGEGDEDYCRREIIEKYGIRKVKAVVSGGKERYHSVYNGLCAAGEPDYVLIHDGARPLVTVEIIERAMESVTHTQASVVGMHVKDTIKITDDGDMVSATPERKNVWMVQTPQAFSFSLVKNAYEQMLEHEDTTITDDAMVVEKIAHHKVQMIEGSYSNIKITTPEDMKIAEILLSEK